VQAELRRGESVVNTFEVASQGPNEIAWDGLSGGRLAPAGRYELRVRAVSRITQQRDSASTYFDLRHEIPTLEDTLPELAAGDLLRERRPASTAWGELGKGAAVAGGVWLIAGALTSGSLGRGDSGKPALVAGTALIAGAFAFVRQRKGRDIPANIAVNTQRREQRRAQVDSIVARNAQRVAATALVVAPAAGVGP
jgi:hypothetical protein